jgi:hypothetical protein
MPGYNMPDGCYESDIPGWDDEDTTAMVYCDDCQIDFEAEVTYNSGTESGDVTCPECNKEWYYEHETDNN